MFTPRMRVLILALFGALLVLSVAGMTRLRFDFSFEAFLPPDDPGLTFYHKHRARFGEGNATISIGLRNRPSVFDRDFLARADSLGRTMRKLPCVQDVNSLATLRDLIYHPLIASTERVLDWRRSEDLPADSARILSDPRMIGNYVSRDGQLLLLNVTLKSPFPDSLEGPLQDSVTAYAARFRFEEWHLVGAPITHHELVKLQQSQFNLYVVLASLVMVLVLAAVFRRTVGVLVAVLSVFSAMALFFGILGWIGQPLDLMATLYPILLVVVGVSDVVHLVAKYVDERQKGLSAMPAIRTTIQEIGVATGLTCITTAVGLFSLMTSSMPPIRNFGWYAGWGVVIVFVGVLLLAPALVTFFRADQLMRQRPEKPMFSGMLGGIARISKNRPRRVLLILGLLLSVSLLGVTRISSNLTSSRDLPWRSRLLHDYTAVDTSMGGLSSMDLALEAGPGLDFRTWRVVQSLDSLERFLHSFPEVSQIHSPNSFIKLAHRFQNGNIARFYCLPPDSIALQQLGGIMDGQLSKYMGSVLSADHRWANLYARIPDIGSRRVDAIRDSLDRWRSGHIDSTALRITHTGQRYLYDVNQEALAFNMYSSIGLSVVIAALFFAIIFRNLRMVIAAMIPNLVPLVLTSGVIGWAGIEMDPKVAMVFSIAYGIAVDDTVHFLSRYALERRKGKSVDDSLHATLQETGKAMVITTMILFFAFSSLMFSPFPPTFTIGFLLSLTLGTALFADLFVNPIVLRWLRA